MSTPIILSRDLPADRRILVTSDIHGHLDHIKNLLKKADFSKNDLLILVGDIVEKGPDSLSTLRYVMQLCQAGNTIALMGNVDLSRLSTIERLKSDPNSAADFLAYLRMMRDWKGTDLYDEMCHELDMRPTTEEELLRSIDPVLTHFSKEFYFLRQLPTALLTQKYLFVHGGIPNPDAEDHLSDLADAAQLLKFDRFQSYAQQHGYCFSHTIVCGHWPTSLYSDTIACQNPIFDPQTNSIAIDGGCGLKKEGQLNLLILPSGNCSMKEIDYLAYDGLPTVTALEAQSASADSVHIHWGDTAGVVVALGKNLILTRHLRSGKELWMPKADLYNYQEPLTVGSAVDLNDWTDYILEVQPGDTLSVVRTLPYGLQVKKNGVTGWYYGKYQ